MWGKDAGSGIEGRAWSYSPISVIRTHRGFPVSSVPVSSEGLFLPDVNDLLTLVSRALRRWWNLCTFATPPTPSLRNVTPGVTPHGTVVFSLNRDLARPGTLRPEIDYKWYPETLGGLMDSFPHIGSTSSTVWVPVGGLRTVIARHAAR